MKVVASRLVRTGRVFVQSALAAYDREDMLVFLLHAGTGLEHMLKARLANLNPALLAKAGHIPSQVWFADEAKHEVSAPPELRTITLDEAMGLVAGIGTPIALYKQDLTVLQRYRNGVAHLGVAEERVAHQVLASFLRAMILLTAEMDVDPTEVFGGFNEFVLLQLESFAAEEERIYQSRLAQARMRFDAEFADLEGEALDRMRDLVVSRWRRVNLDEQMTDCPACGLPGFGEGDLEIIDWEVDVDRDGVPEGASPVFEYRPWHFHCPTCELVLDSPELVKLSGVFNDWEMPSEDYIDYMRHWYDEERADWDY